MLSSYFDLRARCLDRLENEANAERRRQEDERRHRKLITTILASTGSRDRDDAQAELIRSLQQTVANLEAENARLRQQPGNGNSSL